MIQPAGSALHTQNPWYQYNFPSSSEVISLAYRIAEKAHADCVRKKRAGDIPYISHPVMVCLLLQRLGHASDINLAIALLHDVLEDCEPYRSNHLLLRDELKAGLLHSGYDDRAADNTAAYIYQHCEELCNDRIMEEGKRTYQVMHAHAMSDRSKLIKILDQAASVMDDIFLESSRPRDKIERFAMKALNVVKAAARGGTPEILAASEFFHACYVKLRSVHRQLPQHEHLLRDAFDPDTIIASLLGGRETGWFPQEMKPSVTPEIAFMHPAIEQGKGGRGMPQTGCVGLSLVRDRNGGLCVSGYDCLIDRSFEQFSIANRASWYLIGELESFERDSHVEIGDAHIDGRQLMRHYAIHPPLPYGHFIRGARSAERQVQNSARENGVPEAAVPKLSVLDFQMTHSLKDAVAEMSRQENIR